LGHNPEARIARALIEAEAAAAHAKRADKTLRSILERSESARVFP
jgi:hypothetical protein